MGAAVQHEDGNVSVLRVNGLLRKAELDAVQKSEAAWWEPATRVKLLVIVENFEGWERNEGWGDMTFFLKHGDQIEKIAIVADPRWETDLLIFAGAGFRRGAVKFFPTDRLAIARVWLG
jgi:hypothetical protein